MQGKYVSGGGGVGSMGTSGSRNSQLASRSVLNDFTDDGFSISAGILLQSGATQRLEAYLRRRVQDHCWWN